MGEYLDMVLRYTRSVKLDESLRLYKEMTRDALALRHQQFQRSECNRLKRNTG